MHRSVSILALVCAASIAGTPATAEAQIEADPIIIPLAIVGTIAGVTNAIAASVYAVEGRALGSGWVVSSLFTTAICGALTASFIVTAANEGTGVGTTIAVLFYGFLTAWPGYYVVRSALSEAEPGEYFDAEVAPDDTEDPISALTPRAPRVRSIAAFTFEF